MIDNTFDHPTNFRKSNNSQTVLEEKGAHQDILSMILLFAKKNQFF